MRSNTPYQRVLLKISGESFTTPGDAGIDSAELRNIASEIAAAIFDRPPIDRADRKSYLLSFSPPMSCGMVMVHFIIKLFQNPDKRSDL